MGINKVWKILPKEYRQFVQKTYLDLSDESANDYINRPIYAEQLYLLEKIFGKDNLNDCEEIDDVLYVKHQDVIDDFAKAEDTFTKTADRNVKNQMFGKIMELKKLFGWNCFMENVQSEDRMTHYQEKIDEANNVEDKANTIAEKVVAPLVKHIQEASEITPEYQIGDRVEHANRHGVFLITDIEKRQAYGKETFVYKLMNIDGSKTSLFAAENEICLNQIGLHPLFINDMETELNLGQMRCPKCGLIRPTMVGPCICEGKLGLPDGVSQKRVRENEQIKTV